MSKIITDKTNIVAIADAVRSKTGSTEELSLGEIISEIEGISSGGGTTLPTLTSPASEEEVFLDKEFIDQSGVKKTGSFTIEEEMSEQDSLISQIQTALEGKMSGGAEFETCTVTLSAQSYSTNGRRQHLTFSREERITNETANFSTTV